MNNELETALDGLRSKLEDKLNQRIESEKQDMQKQFDQWQVAQKHLRFNGSGQTVKSQIERSIIENASKFKAFAENNIPVRIKAATTIDTGSFGAGVVQGLREQGINEAPMRRRSILSLIRSLNGGPGSNPLTWVEWKPKDGGPDTVAESATKPLMDWTYTEGTSNAEVIAVTSYVTRQVLLNAPVLADHINNELLMNLADELDYQILLGSGTSPDLKGISQYAKAFTGSSLAGTIEDANIYDVIRAAVLQVREGNRATTGYSRRTGYTANYALVSPADAAQMDLIKDSNGQYIMPPFSERNGQIVNGVQIIESDFVDTGDFYVGDFSKSLVNFVEGITIQTGLVNDQFVKNQMTLRAECYAAHRVKYHDAWAFVKGDFSSAKALLQATT